MVANGIEQTAEKVGLAEATGLHGIGPPANRRVEFNGSGAPSGMMTQRSRHRGQIGSGRALLDPDLAREQGCSKRALA